MNVEISFVPPAKIVSYKWELTKSPIGYNQKLPEGATLTLEDLIPGNYSLKVTVADEEGLTGSATAEVVVLKVGRRRFSIFYCRWWKSIFERCLSVDVL